MIYTTYFANLKNLPPNIIPVSIACKAPDEYKGLQYKKLAPKYDFYIEYEIDHDREKYTKCYERILDTLETELVDVGWVIDEISELVWNKAIADGKDPRTVEIALVCYEKPTDFCHRHLVRNWLNYHGYECEEYMNKT